MPALYPGQYFLTKEQFPDITSLHHLVISTPPRPMCLHDYWIAYIREDRVLAVDCIKSQPVWMSEMKEYIGSIPLHALMIPGTHNSGSWDEFKSYTDDTVLMRFSVNQGEAVWNQLLLGVRLVNMTLFQHVIILLLLDTSTCVSAITTTLRKSFGLCMTLSNRIHSTKLFKLSRGSSG